MTGSEMSGVPAAMEAYGVYAPQTVPQTLVVVSTVPPVPAGLPTGIDLAAVGQSAAAEFVALLTQATEKLVADAASVGVAAADYTAADAVSSFSLTSVTAADVTSALQTATKAVVLVEKAIGLVKTATTALQTSDSADESDGSAAADSPTTA